MFAINAFTKHRLFIKLQNIMKSPIISNYSIEQETIDSILEFEYCPTLTTFWQNLLIYTIFDVSFGESNMDKTKTLKIQYIYNDINITVSAQNIDVIAITVLYRNEIISLKDKNLNFEIKSSIAHILREFLEIIYTFVPTLVHTEPTDGSDANKVCVLACKCK